MKNIKKTYRKSIQYIWDVSRRNHDFSETFYIISIWYDFGDGKTMASGKIWDNATNA